MPGSTPATSQLDWLSSTTAMIVLSWSKATRDLLKACPGEGRGRSAGSSGHSVSYLPATMVPSPSPPAPYHLSGGGSRIRTLGPPLRRARCIGRVRRTRAAIVKPERPIVRVDALGDRFAARLGTDKAGLEITAVSPSIATRSAAPNPCV